jgi:hypothetical protein
MSIPLIQNVCNDPFGTGSPVGPVLSVSRCPHHMRDAGFSICAYAKPLYIHGGTTIYVCSNPEAIGAWRFKEGMGQKQT